jgi:WD40 repeat protein
VQLALSPDGLAIAIGGDFRPVIRVHDTAAGRRLVELKGDWAPERAERVAHMAFALDGRSLAALIPRPGTGCVIVWDVGSGKERYRRPAEAYANPCVFSPDGKRLAVSGNANELTIWDAADGKEVRRFAAGTSVTAAAFAPDGKTLAAALAHGPILLWDVDSGKRLPQSADTLPPVSQLLFTQGGKQLVGAAGDLIAWDPATGREVRRLPRPGLHLGGVSPSGKLLAVPRTNFTTAIQLQDTLTSKVLRPLAGETFSPPRLIRFTPDERRLIASYDDEKMILVWDAASGKLVHRLTGLTGTVNSMAVSPDGRWLASCSSNPKPGHGDEVLRLWDLHTGREAKRLPHKFLATWDLAFSPDGTRLAAGGIELHRLRPGRVQVWEVPSGRDFLTFDTHTGTVHRVAFSPDGRTLATGGMDATLRLWEVATGRERLRLRGHNGVIEALTFAPDGQTLAAASADAPVFVWDVADRPRPQQNHFSR